MMIRNDAFFTSISNKHTLNLLLYLKEVDNKVILKDLQHITNHTQTLRMRLDEMKLKQLGKKESRQRQNN